MFRSAMGLPVKWMTVLPLPVSDAAGVGGVLVAVPPPVACWLLQGEAGHSDSALICHVTDLISCGTLALELTMLTWTEPAQGRTAQQHVVVDLDRGWPLSSPAAPPTGV